MYRSRLYKDLLEAFELMQVTDVLDWDVENMRSASNMLRDRATSAGWIVSVRCDPPMEQKYTATPGRLRIVRHV